jgi:tetratricopeptide (TPR) repeat protein
VTATDVDDATALEAAAAQQHPDQRSEILMEAAAAWFRAGEIERGVATLTDLVDAGGEDGCYARVQLVEFLFDGGRAAAGYAQLTALARDPALHDGHCTIAAELLASRDDLEGALQWYDRFVARLDPVQIEALRGPDGWMQLASVPLRGRRHVRQQLGLRPDATDEIVPTAPLERSGGLDRVRELLAADAPTPQRVELRMLTFQRAERAEVRRRWPDVYVGTDEEYYPATELDWRARAEHGGPPMLVVPGVAVELVAFAERVGGSPTDLAVRTSYIDTVPVERMVRWPPGRNAPCWCGSGTKYKKCCGGVR